VGETMTHRSAHHACNLTEAASGARCRANVEITAAAPQPPPWTRRNNTMKVKSTVRAGLGPIVELGG